MKYLFWVSAVIVGMFVYFYWPVFVGNYCKPDVVVKTTFGGGKFFYQFANGTGFWSEEFIESDMICTKGLFEAEEKIISPLP